jgi:hypothetical protein
MGRSDLHQPKLFAWLGRLTVFTWKAFTVLGKLTDFEPELDDPRGLHSITFPQIQDWRAKAFGVLGKMEYWQRAWVLQEFTLAADATIHWGQFSIHSELARDYISYFSFS